MSKHLIYESWIGNVSIDISHMGYHWSNLSSFLFP